MAYSPGPWTIEKHDFRDVIAANGVFDATGKMVIVSAWGESIEQADANTALIAAAPDMLAELQATLEWLQSGTVDGVHFDEQSIIDAIAAVIRKAVQS